MPPGNATSADGSGRGRGRPRRRHDAPPRTGASTPNRGLLRHQARTLALQVLYEIEVTGHDPRQALANALRGAIVDEEGGEALPAVPPEVAGYVESLVHGTLLYLYKLDPLLSEFAPAFAAEQTPPVDRSVLRLGAYELLYGRDVPPKVAINEAVELAKRFGGESSGRFVNGVLARVLERREELAAARPAAAAPTAPEGASRAPMTPPGGVGDDERS